MIDGFERDVCLSTSVLGGLGDILLFSTLAERFTAEGHRVYLHKECMARNDEILDLCWGLNPFIVDVGSNQTPDVGYARVGRFYDTLNTLPKGWAVAAMEMAHGLPPPYSLNPKIYYKPQPTLHDVSNVVLFDMHSLSSAIHEMGWEAFHTKCVDRFGPLTLVDFPETIAPRIPNPQGVPTITMNSIYEYIDAMAACRAWCGSEAGGQSLAAAVRGEHHVDELDVRPEVVCLMAPNTYNSGSYCHRGVKYQTSKFAAGSDYLEPVEVPFYRYHQTCLINNGGRLNQWRQSKGVK